MGRSAYLAGLASLSAAVAGLVAMSGCTEPKSLPGTQRVDAPRASRVEMAPVDPRAWHGFNLLNMFWQGTWDEPFEEDDFAWIHELGFNFVRLPLDYRLWQTSTETKLARIDQAIAFGEKYGVHVCLNLHRAPGYCVSGVKEPTSLWTDPSAQAAFVKEWQRFAARYRGVPPASLSFNLVNEPSIDERDAATYDAIMRSAVNAIREIDPSQPILIDGLAYGNVPPSSMLDLGIIGSARGYRPNEQLASWTPESRYPEPTWPLLRINGMLFGKEGKPQIAGPQTILGLDDTMTAVTIDVEQVSGAGTLVVQFDTGPAYSRAFSPGPGTGEWSKVVFNEQWKIYQNLYDLKVRVARPPGAKSVTFRVAPGDWIAYRSIEIERFGAPAIKVVTNERELRRSSDLVLKSGALDVSHVERVDKAWLEGHFETWRDFEARGGTVFVGELGAKSTVPHPVVLAWLNDQMKIFDERRWGWALWMFRGDYGVLDSGRKDVTYEDFHGHKLDREMLNVLRRSLP